MKKIAILFSLLLFWGMVYSQEEPVQTWEGLEKQKEKTDEEIKHDKKKLKVSTWSKRSNIYYDIYSFVTKGLYVGMPADDNFISVKSIAKEPGKKFTQGDMEIWEYEHMNLYIKNGLLEKIEQTEFIDENALEKSAEALLKAVEIDEKGKFKEKTTTMDMVQMIKTSIINDAITHYVDAGKAEENQKPEKSKELYSKAYSYMDYGYKLLELPKNEDDTIFSRNQVGYFLGVISFKAEDYDKSKMHFQNCIDIDYEGGAAYHYLAESYAASGDSVKFIEVIKEGFDKYPEEEQLIIDLINFYMTKNQTEKAIEYIDIAIEKNPENPSYYSAKATVYDNGTEKIKEEYKKQMDMAEEFKKEAFRNRNNPNSKAYKEAIAGRDEAFNKSLELLKEFESNLDKAEKLYTESLEIDPKFFNAAYNIGRVYLKRQEMYKEHSNYPLRIIIKKDFEKSEEIENKSKEYMKVSAEKFEIAHEINPQDRDVLEVLKRIYFTLRDKENENIVIEKLEALGKETNNIE